MINGTPSPWTGMSVDQMKIAKDKMKLSNDIQEQAIRAQEIEKKATEELQKQQDLTAMDETIPYLDRG